MEQPHQIILRKASLVHSTVFSPLKYKCSMMPSIGDDELRDRLVIGIIITSY